MAKAFFIGGPPRVGKSTLAMQVVAHKPMMAASTDAIRYVLRRTHGAEQNNGLFLIHNHNTDDSEMARYLKDSAQVLQDQKDEIMAVWPAVLNYIKSNVEDGWDVVIEGIHILPELLNELDIEYNVVFVGNQSPEHINQIRNHAKNTQTDWLHTHAGDVIDGWAQFTQQYSEFISAEAAKYDMAYIEVHDHSFEADMDTALRTLLN